MFNHSFLLTKTFLFPSFLLKKIAVNYLQIEAAKAVAKAHESKIHQSTGRNFKKEAVAKSLREEEQRAALQLARITVAAAALSSQAPSSSTSPSSSSTVLSHSQAPSSASSISGRSGSQSPTNHLPPLINQQFNQQFEDALETLANTASAISSNVSPFQTASPDDDIPVPSVYVIAHRLGKFTNSIVLCSFYSSFQFFSRILTGIPNEMIPHLEFVNGGHGIRNPMLKSLPDSRVVGKQAASPEDPLKCNICSKKFELPRLLNRHMKCHSDVKRYLCSFCGKGFNDTFDLKRHTRTHTGKSLLNCLACLFVYSPFFLFFFPWYSCC